MSTDPNQKVLIVDDISTTGATAQEIARSLISYWPALCTRQKKITH